MKTLFSPTRIARLAGPATLTLLALSAFAAETNSVDVQSGQASFESITNMPGVEVKGKSTALVAHLDLIYDNDNLVLQKIRASVPVKSLATGMKVRDEHMRKYIFTTADGKEPDLEFASDSVNCAPVAAHEFACPVSGSFSIRGVARPFSMQLRVKEQGTASYRASGDATLKLSRGQPSQRNRDEWRSLDGRAVRSAGVRQWGILGEHDVTERNLKTGTMASFQQNATYGQFFWAAREWLVPSLIVERLEIGRPYKEHLNAAKIELAARLTSQLTISAGPRIQRDELTDRIAKSVVFQIALKTVH